MKLELISPPHGGYYVSGKSDFHEVSGEDDSWVLFAGMLDDCLAFMRQQFAEAAGAKYGAGQDAGKKSAIMGIDFGSVEVTGFSLYDNGQVRPPFVTKLGDNIVEISSAGITVRKIEPLPSPEDDQIPF